MSDSTNPDSSFAPISGVSEHVVNPADAPDAGDRSGPLSPNGDVAPVFRRSFVPALAIIAIISLLVDQVTKYLAVTHLEIGERIPVIGDLLGWRLVYNPGAALSLGTGVTWVFTLVMVVVSVAVMVVAKRIGSRTWAIALGALLGGALGNLTDRLVREPGFGVGHVVDFIDYGVFIGNVADIAIVGAAVAIVALSLFGQSWDGKPESPSEVGTSESVESSTESSTSMTASPSASAKEGEASNE